MDQLLWLGKRELICLLLFTCNYVASVFERFPLPLGAWDGLRYFIVALPGPSIFLFGFSNQWWVNLKPRHEKPLLWFIDKVKLRVFSPARLPPRTIFLSPPRIRAHVRSQSHRGILLFRRGSAADSRWSPQIPVLFHRGSAVGLQCQMMTS